MAIVPLTPIGSPRDQVCDDRTYGEYRETLDKARASLAALAAVNRPVSGC